uniref:Proline rich membrane anchor 1 n=1 Tax=Felis catus TaxID=9685 RepID=A0ABI7Z6B4_FELCA
RTRTAPAPPRPGQPRGATGKGGDPGRLAPPAPGGSEETFPALPSASAARPGPGRGVPPLPTRARPGAARSRRALRPVRARRARPPLGSPRGPSRAQTFAPAPGAPPRHVKPPGARAVARVTHGEPQKSCSKVTDSCQHICQCRPPPLLPPPPPPPPPPRLLSAPAPNSTSCPAEESWWSGLVIVIAVCCASLVFLTVLVIICYKAIKRQQTRLQVPVLRLGS